MANSGQYRYRYLTITVTTVKTDYLGGSTTGTTVQTYDLTDEIVIIDSGTTIIYPEITPAEFALLDDESYEERRDAVIDNLGIKNPYRSALRLSSSGTDLSACPLPPPPTTTTTTIPPSVAATTTTTTTTSTTTTTTTITPTTTVNAVSCNSFVNGNFGTSNSYHTYPSTIVDMGEGTSGSVIWDYVSNDTPNRFTVKNYSDGTTVGGTDWVGTADYGGPWGAPPFNNAPSGNFTFTKSSSERYYVLVVETVTGPVLTDAFTVQLSCV
jgi:hypothetical protein